MKTRDYALELENRVAFIRNLVETSGMNGIVFGNSGGKDSALVGILCKKACENTVGVKMPCHSKVNYTTDIRDADAVSEMFGIESRTVDISDVKDALLASLAPVTDVSASGNTNIAPRLRMSVLYTIAASERRLVAGTGNRSEIYMGYYTKWGDGAYDFDPIADLTASEVFAFLRFLGAPAGIIEKAPSAGLFEGQTDESEMGVTYAAIDRFLLTGEADAHDREIIERYHARSLHKTATNRYE